MCFSSVLVNRYVTEMFLLHVIIHNVSSQIDSSFQNPADKDHFLVTCCHFCPSSSIWWSVCRELWEGNWGQEIQEEPEPEQRRSEEEPGISNWGGSDSAGFWGRPGQRGGAESGTGQQIRDCCHESRAHWVRQVTSTALTRIQAPFIPPFCATISAVVVLAKDPKQQPRNIPPEPQLRVSVPFCLLHQWHGRFVFLPLSTTIPNQDQTRAVFPNTWASVTTKAAAPHHLHSFL